MNDMQITDLLAFGVKNKASDLHISAGLPPMIRVHGDMRRINLPDMSGDEVGKMIASVMNDFVHQSCQETRVAYQYNPAHQYERPIYQILGFYPEEYDAHVASMLPEHLKLVRWHRLGVDILPREGSKARGIAASLQQLDLTLHDAWAFGDGHNDLEMIQEVAFGVVMADGEEILKTYADYVCPSAKEDGIYHCLIQLGIIQAR